MSRPEAEARDVTSGPALITGATGFVGAAVARALLSAGFSVRALARPGSPRGNLAGIDVEVVAGDLADPASLRAALKGARHLFHVAADYRLWARDPEEIVRNNLEGARNMMTAAIEAGIERVVYTSSVATLGFRPDGAPGDETLPLAAHDAVGAYKRSKVLAERVVETLAGQSGLDVVIVNPSTPVGPRDIKPTPTGRIILEAAQGRIPAFVDTGLNLVHVDDVAEGHVLAWRRGQSGRRYVLGGQDVSLRRMLADIAGLVGRRAPTLGLPRAPLWPLAAVAETVGRMTGQEPLLTRDALKMASHHMFFSSARAEAELGYRARPYQAGLEDAVSWFREHGRLPA
jgi:dihydroflavonol-4-reductase